MGVFSRNRLDPKVTADMARTGERPLAWARSGDQWVIGTASALLLGEAGSWSRYRWHQIAVGGWDGAERVLRWTTYDRARVELRLDAPGRLPELFAERIQASIVVNQQVKVPGDDGGAVIIAGRRAAGCDVIEWHVSLANGTTWQTPGARETTELLLARIQAEFESG